MRDRGLPRWHQKAPSTAGKPVDAKEGGAGRRGSPLFGARNTICAGAQESTRWVYAARPVLVPGDGFPFGERVGRRSLARRALSADPRPGAGSPFCERSPRRSAVSPPSFPTRSIGLCTPTPKEFSGGRAGRAWPPSAAGPQLRAGAARGCRRMRELRRVRYTPRQQPIPAVCPGQGHPFALAIR
jgi:hypothetical protein